MGGFCWAMRGNREQGGPNGDWVISDIHARLDQLERTRPSNFSAGLPEKPAAASEPPAASTSPAAAEQDDCEEIHCLCTEFVPGWKDLGMGDLSVKKFSAGCSGAMVAKGSTKRDVQVRCASDLRGRAGNLPTGRRHHFWRDLPGWTPRPSKGSDHRVRRVGIAKRY